MSVGGDAGQETEEQFVDTQSSSFLLDDSSDDNAQDQQLEQWMEPQNPAGVLAETPNTRPVCLQPFEAYHSEELGLTGGTGKEDPMNPVAVAASSTASQQGAAPVIKIPVAGLDVSGQPTVPDKSQPGMLYASPVRRTVVRVKLRGVNPNELNPTVAVPGLLQGLRTNFPSQLLVGCGVRAGCVELTLEFIEAPNQQGTLMLAPGQAQQIAQLLAQAAQASEHGSDGQQHALMQQPGTAEQQGSEGSEGDAPSLAQAMLTLPPGDWLQWLGLAQERAGPVAVNMGMDPSAPLDAAVAALSDPAGTATSATTQSGAQVTVTVKVDDVDPSTLYPTTPSFASLQRHSGRLRSSTAASSQRATPFSQSAASLQGVSGNGSIQNAPASPARASQRHSFLQQAESGGELPATYMSDADALQSGCDQVSGPGAGAHDIARVMTALSEGADSPPGDPEMWPAAGAELDRFPCCQSSSHAGSLSDTSTLMPLRGPSVVLDGGHPTSPSVHAADSDEEKAVRISALAPIAIVAFHDEPSPVADVDAFLHLSPTQDGFPSRGPILAHLIIKLCASRRAATTALRHAVEGVRFTARCQGHDVPLNLQPLMPTGAEPPAAWLQQQQRLAQLLATKHAAAAATTALTSRGGRSSRNQAMMRGLRERRAAAYASMAAEAATALASNTLDSDGVLGRDQMVLVDEDLAVTCWAISLDVRTLRLPAVLYLEVWAGHELLDSQPVVLLDSTTAPIAPELAELAQSGTRRAALSTAMPIRRAPGAPAPVEPPGAPAILPYQPIGSEQQQQAELREESMYSPAGSQLGPASSITRPTVHTWADGSGVKLGAMSEGGAVHNSRHVGSSQASETGHWPRARQRMQLAPQRSEPLPPHMSGGTASEAAAAAAPAGASEQEWSAWAHGTDTSSDTHYDSAVEEEYGHPPAGVSTHANTRAFLQDLGTWMAYCTERLRRAAAQQKQSLTPAGSMPPLSPLVDGSGDATDSSTTTTSSAAHPRLVHSLLQQQGAADGSSEQNAPKGTASVAEGLVSGPAAVTGGEGRSRPASSMTELDELLDELQGELGSSSSHTPPADAGSASSVLQHQQQGVDAMSQPLGQLQGAGTAGSTAQQSEEAAAALMGAFMSRLAHNALAEDPAAHAHMVDLGTCLLHYAVLCGWPALASRLLSELVSPSVGGCTFKAITHHRGSSLFNQAVRSGRPSMIRIIVLWGHRFSYTWSSPDQEALVITQPQPPVVRPPEHAIPASDRGQAALASTAIPVTTPAWQQDTAALGETSGEGSSVRDVLLAARAANSRRRQRLLQDNSTQDAPAQQADPQHPQLSASPPGDSNAAYSLGGAGSTPAHPASRAHHGGLSEDVGTNSGTGLELNQLLHDRQQSSLASSQLTPAVGTVPSPSDTVPSDGLASGSSTLEGTVHRDASQGTSRPVNKTVDGVDPHWVAGHHTMTLRHLLLGFPDPHLERRYQLASAGRQAPLLLPWSLVILLMAAYYIMNVAWTVEPLEVVAPLFLLAAPYIPLAYMAASPVLHSWLEAGLLACALGRVAFQVLLGCELCDTPYAVAVLIRSHLDIILDTFLLSTLEKFRTRHAVPLRCFCLGSYWAVYKRLGLQAPMVLSSVVNLCGLSMTMAVDWFARMRFLRTKGTLQRSATDQSVPSPIKKDSVSYPDGSY